MRRILLVMTLFTFSLGYSEEHTRLWSWAGFEFMAACVSSQYMWMVPSHLYSPPISIVAPYYHCLSSYLANIGPRDVDVGLMFLLAVLCWEIFIVVMRGPSLHAETDALVDAFSYIITIPSPVIIKTANFGIIQQCNWKEMWINTLLWCLESLFFIRGLW